MTADKFKKLLEMRIRAIRSSLETKATEYATDDRLHNFKSAAAEFGGKPSEVLWGYLLKHLQSLMDMAKGVKPAEPKAVSEKIGDAINYLILLEALFLEPFMESFK